MDSELSPKAHSAYKTIIEKLAAERKPFTDFNVTDRALCELADAQARLEQIEYIVGNIEEFIEEAFRIDHEAEELLDAEPNLDAEPVEADISAGSMSGNGRRCG